MSKNSDRKKIQQAVSSFFSELNGDNPNIDKLVEIAKNNPDLLKSDEFIKRAFPKCEKSKLPSKLGLLKTDKLMKTVDVLKQMKEKDPSLAENVNDFMSKNHPSNGENVVTFLAKNAVAAYDKANIDRAPEENLSEADKKILNDQHNKYVEQLQQLKKDGYDLNTPNALGQTISDIDGMSVAKNNTERSPLASLELQNPVRVSEERDNGEIEVGGERQPLKVKTPEKPALKVNTEGQEEQENEGEVVDAPEDRGKSGEHKWGGVKEQDIIQYMYEQWFLAGLDKILEKTTGWIESSVDNLCDDFVRKAADVREQKKEIKSKRVKDFKDKGLDVLRNYPAQMTQQFQQGFENKNGLAKRINQDIRDNISKNPPQWSVLNPNNESDKKLIDTLTTKYNQDPAAFMQTLDSLDNKNSLSQKAMVKMYGLAVEMATVQLMHKKMKSGRLGFADDDPKKIKAELDKLAQKNLEKIIKGVNGVAEHTKLACIIRDGETDMNFTQESSAKSVAKFLEVLTIQTAKAKADLNVDLEDGNFKANDGTSKTKASENVKKMNAIVDDGEKYYEVLVPTKKAVGLPVGLETEAHNINVAEIRNGDIRESVIGDVEALKADTLTSAQRKAAFEMQVKKMRNDKDFMNQDSRATNPKEVVASIIASRQRRGNE